MTTAASTRITLPASPAAACSVHSPTLRIGRPYWPRKSSRFDEASAQASVTWSPTIGSSTSAFGGGGRSIRSAPT